MANRLICGCVRVYEQDIVEAVRQGARSYDEVQAKLLCGTSCGNCRILVEKVIKSCLEDDASATS